MLKLLIVFALALCFQLHLFAEPIPGIPSTLVTRDAASVPVGTDYGGANTSVFSNMAGKKNFSIYNGSSTVIAVGVRSNSCSIANTSDNFVIPGSTGLVIENVAMAKALCLRSLAGSSAAAGTIYLSVW